MLDCMDCPKRTDDSVPDPSLLRIRYPLIIEWPDVSLLRLTDDRNLMVAIPLATGMMLSLEVEVE